MRSEIFVIILIVMLTCCKNKDYIINTYDTGTISSEGLLINNKKEGKWIYYDSEKDTTNISFFKNDTLIKKIEFMNNLRLKETNYKNGKMWGNVTMFYPDGSIECKGIAKNDKYEGEFVCYDKNGKLSRKANYIKGELVGEFIQYYPNGNIHVYTEKIGNGIHKVYDTIGNLKYKILFESYKPIDTIEIHK